MRTRSSYIIACDCYLEGLSRKIGSRGVREKEKNGTLADRRLRMPCSSGLDCVSEAGLRAGKRV